MSDDEITKLAIQGFIASLPDGERTQVEELIADIRVLLAAHRIEYGHLAIALLGAEMQLASKGE